MRIKSCEFCKLSKIFFFSLYRFFAHKNFFASVIAQKISTSQHQTATVRRDWSAAVHYNVPFSQFTQIAHASHLLCAYFTQSTSQAKSRDPVDNATVYCRRRDECDMLMRERTVEWQRRRCPAGRRSQAGARRSPSRHEVSSLHWQTFL